MSTEMAFIMETVCRFCPVPITLEQAAPSQSYPEVLLLIIATSSVYLSSHTKKLIFSKIILWLCHICT